MAGRRHDAKIVMAFNSPVVYEGVLQVVEGKARNSDKSARLWGGDTTGYNTPSEATAVLLCLLAYWTNKHHWRMDRLFRQSGLIRNKWDRKQSGSTWGALEIGKAGGR